LNIPENEKWFKEFIRENYKAFDVNVSGEWNYTNYEIYFTSTLEDVE
jgi:hypothetical protein